MTTHKHLSPRGMEPFRAVAVSASGCDIVPVGVGSFGTTVLRLKLHLCLNANRCSFAFLCDGLHCVLCCAALGLPPWYSNFTKPQLHGHLPVCDHQQDRVVMSWAVRCLDHVRGSLPQVAAFPGVSNWQKCLRSSFSTAMQMFAHLARVLVLIVW